MGISEFTVHNVLRTYSRQERLGQVNRSRAKSAAAPASTDRVSLTSTGQKVQSVGLLAAEVVDRRHPELPPEDRKIQARRTQDELLKRHEGDILDDTVSPKDLEARLRPLYLV